MCQETDLIDNKNNYKYKHKQTSGIKMSKRDQSR